MAAALGLTARTGATQATAAFSLLGGPLHRLGCRLGLVRRGTNTIRVGLALGLPSWAILMALGLLEGLDPPSLDVLAVHTGLLVVIPLLFLCETRWDPRLAQLVDTIVWVRVGQLTKMIDAFTRSGVRHCVMAGHPHVLGDTA